MSVPVVSSATLALTTGNCDVVAYTGTAAQSQVMTGGQTYRLVCTTDAWITVGTNPTAVAGADGNVFMPAGRELYLYAHTASLKVSAVQASLGGSLSQVLVSP